MQNPDIYFSFPDKTLHYDCSACNALCCRGAGFGGSLAHELPALFDKYPALAQATVGLQGSSHLVLMNPAGGCFFLQPDNRCGIEQAHGKSAKPSVCSLFPFNQLSMLADTLVVSPHFLCPLQLRRDDSAAGNHTALLHELEKSGLAASTEHLPRVSTEKGKSVRRLLRVEAAFRDAALSETCFRTFLYRQSQHPAALQVFLARSLALLSIEDAEPAAGLDGAMLVLSSTLRLSLLTLPDEGRLRALLLLDALLRILLPLSTQPVSLQGVWQLASAILPRARLLAHDEAVFSYSPKSQVPQEPSLALGALAFLRRASRGEGTLSALEAAIPASFSALERAVLLQHLGTLPPRRR